MGEYMCLYGTRDKIAVDLAEKLNLPPEVLGSEELRQFTNQFVNFISENHKTLLSADDDFQMEKFNRGASHGFTNADGSYFIGLKKSTYILIFSILKGIISTSGLNSTVSEIIDNAIDELVQELVPDKDMPFFKRLGKGTERNCILLEAAKYKKKGIKDDHFEKFGGNCIRNDLRCVLRVEGMCTCSRKRTRDACCELETYKILKEKNGKFFYVDYI